MQASSNSGVEFEALRSPPDTPAPVSDAVSPIATPLPGLASSSEDGQSPVPEGITPALAADDSSADSSEKDKKKKEKKPPKARVPYHRLYRFATCFDALLIVIGVAAAMGGGVLMPINMIFMGNMVNSFGMKIPAPPNITNATFSSSTASWSSYVAPSTASSTDMSGVIRNAKVMVALGAGAFVLQLINTAAFTYSSTRQGAVVRTRYFGSALAQEMGWFDAQKIGEFTARITDINKIEDGIGEPVGTFLQALVTFMSGWFIGFWYGWKMALVLISMVPLIVICVGILATVFKKLVLRAQDFYAKAGQVAEEILACVRTVTSFGIQRDALRRYDNNLLVTMKMGYFKGLSTGLSMGAFFIIMFGAYALAFWYGAQLIDGPVSIVNGFYERKSEMDAGTVLTVFFSIMMGAMSLSQVGPIISVFFEASGIASEIFSVIDRPSSIDPRSDQGEKIEIRGKIELRNVHFRYPTRPQVEILKGISLTIEEGKTVALVGGSGSGKSTIVSLVERFYDAEDGEILVDGKPIKTLNVQHLRSQIGAVTQEPVLFATTIGKNISYGCHHQVTEEEIIEAAKRANAHTFISQLPNAYDTLVGERGVQLSGGQKQRIAIARALIRKPKLLVFDEATSALDTESEQIVQAAIDEVAHGHTCIIVAHRLSTVRNADLILALENGLVKEAGNHEELMAMEGLYYTLVKKQQLAGGTEEKKKHKKRHHKMKAEEATKEVEKALEEEAEKPVKWATLIRAFKLLKPNVLFVLIASAAACVSGAVFPVFAYIMSDIMAVLIKVAILPDNSSAMSDVKFWAVAFIVLGVIAAIGMLLQNASMEIAGERLTRYLRYESFKAMLRQDIGWFDDEKNLTGILSTRLATDATFVHKITGTQVQSVVQLISSLGVGIGIGFSGSWKLGLVMLSCLPFIIAANGFHMRYVMTHQQQKRKSYEKSGQIASEALQNARTVSILGKQTMFQERYRVEIYEPMKKGAQTTLIHALSRAFQQLSQMWMAALSFWYGAKLVESDGIDFAGLMKAQTAVMFAAMAVGQISSNFMDFGKGLAAATSIFELLDRKPPIPPPAGVHLTPVGVDDEQNQKTVEEELAKQADSEAPSEIKGFTGEIEFVNVEFTYPTRPGVQILKGLSFTAKPQQTVALVGSSGCGKSTVISLLQRFYDPSAGTIFVDGRPITSLNIGWLRSQMGLVSQEPILFATSIRENISYGRSGATMDEIVDAAKSANAHNFISGFPDGYETMVGEKGVTLSGGQKQRIAIARALLRNPKILLLDEATSALDTNSEAVVQEALDRARLGRTTLVIAHRLSTIVNADKIIVFEAGKIVEIGTHSELMAVGGVYANLASRQVR